MTSTLSTRPMVPPMLLRMRIRNRGHRFSLWVPLFLIGPLATLLVLLVAVVLLPFIPVAAAVLWHRGFGRWLMLGASLLLSVGPLLFVLLCSLRGLTVEVNDGPEQVYVAFK